LPYIFYFVYTKVYDLQFYTPDFTTFQIIKLPDYTLWNTTTKIWLGIVFVIGLFSFFELFRWLYKKSIRSRKSFIIILFYFILTCFIVLFGPDDSWYYLLSPLSIIIANFFTYTKKQKIANLLFLLLIISSIAYRYLIVI
jgi:hypothetical protein